ncbi:MAG TPA: SsrA-binding protein, partial [Desulfobacterales bacterium]|nr:SsrA-binding protein [Desulfobacterales bacterium]
VDPMRARKLLLHKKEIRYLAGKTAEKGWTLVPLRLYFSEANLVKVELGVARGKKQHDKRASIAERDHQRDVERALRDRQKG